MTPNRPERRSPRSVVITLAAVCFGLGLISPPAAGAVAPAAAVPTVGDSIEVAPAVAQDTSKPLREMPVIPPSRDGAAPENRPVPEARQEALSESTARPQVSPFAPVPQTPLPMPGTRANFEGMQQPNGYYPPDTNGDVGPREYVQIVNTSFAVYAKDGTLLYGPANNNTLWGGFGGDCQNQNDGDPIVQYDQLADRWLISQFAVSGATNLECVAVSVTSDPLGAYYRYAFDYGDLFPDYPKIGVWPDGYYVTYNVFDDDGFVGVKVCSLERRAMLVGAPASQQCADLAEAFSLLPADVDGPTPPPVGAPNYVVGLNWSDNDKLTQYKFHVDWDNPADSTFSAPIDIPVAPFTPACTGVFRGRCVPQPGTAVLLESLGNRTMYRLAYRNFGDHESLVTNQTVAVDNNPGLSSQLGIRWYEIRSPGAATPVLHQEGTSVSPSSGEFRWMASMAMDKQGNIGMGYSSSSTTLFPSINYIGRLASDPLGIMVFDEGTIQVGAGSQTGASARWGDYTGTNVDPVDDCTFWHTNQYLKETSERNWSTRIASFALPGCEGNATVPKAPQNVNATSGLGQVAVDWDPPADNGGMAVVGYRVTASPGGATCETLVGVDPDPTACTVPGLTDGTAYTFGVEAFNAMGASPAALAGPVTPGSSLVSLTPVRVADTRLGEPVAFPVDKVPVPAGTSLAIPIAGSFGVPVDAPAVSLNVTAVQPTAAGHLRVYPCGQALPTSSNVNFTAGQRVPNAVLTAVGTGGEVCVYTSATTDLVVDLNGWLPIGAGFTAQPPQRIADSRPDAPEAQPPDKGMIPAGSTLEVPVGGQFGVPIDAAAVSLNVTVIGPVGAGHATVFPCGVTKPNASTLNFVAGQLVANAAITPLGAGGKVCIYTTTEMNIAVDLNGWFQGPPGFTPQTPVRVADTRAGMPVAFPLPKATLQAGAVMEIPIGGQFGVPGDAGGVSLNVTAIAPNGAGHLTVYPCGQPQVSSNLNFVAGQVVPNAVLTGLGAGGKACVISSSTTDLAVDLNGWFPAN